MDPIEARDIIEGPTPVPPPGDRWGRWVAIGAAAALVVAAVVIIAVTRSATSTLDAAMDPNATTVTAPPSSPPPSPSPSSSEESTVLATTDLSTTLSPSTAPSTTVASTTAPVTTSPATVAPTTAAPATTVPPAPTTTVAVPARLTLPPGVSILSGAFASRTTGWVVADRPQPDGTSVPQLLSTTDRGTTWTVRPLDALPQRVAFADASNGWVVTVSGLRSTHDGGRTWAPVALTGATDVEAVESDGGVVHVVAFVATDNAFAVFTSPIGQDAFVAGSLRIPPGAGPRADFQIVLQGANGWLLLNDRVVTGGARLLGGTWQAWTPPCIDTSGAGDVDEVALAAAPGGRRLVAVCAPSGFGAPHPGQILVSDDAGTTFRPVAALPPNFTGTFGDSFAVVAPSDSTFGVLFTPAGPAGQFAITADAGATWRRAVPTPPGPSGEPFIVPSGPVVVPVAGGGIVSDDDGATWRLEATP